MYPRLSCTRFYNFTYYYKNPIRIDEVGRKAKLWKKTKSSKTDFINYKDFDRSF